MKHSTDVKKLGALVAGVLISICQLADAGPREQAKQMHDRLVGTPPAAAVLDDMAAMIAGGGDEEAAYIAMQQPDFYRTTLKNFATPWTNRDRDGFAPLNDYSATVIGMVRDDADFREVLTGDYLYVGAEAANLPAYSPTDNGHYEALETRGLDLNLTLERVSQSSLMGIPASAAAGIMTSRGAARAFFIDGTNRAMFRFTLLNHLCLDLEQVSDTSRSPGRIRQDVTRSPGGDSRLFRNNCVGCHAGMDPMAQAFAYYSFVYADDAATGQLVYNEAGQVDPATGTRVVEKYHINPNNFPAGFVTRDDRWDNYWRRGRNQALGWDLSLPGFGTGAKSLGEELAGSQAFAQCQVSKVFAEVCLRSPQDENDRTQIELMTSAFKSSGYQLKRPFADAAIYCKGS